MIKTQQAGYLSENFNRLRAQISATLCALLLGFGTADAQESWKLKTESGGIKIFMRSVPNSAIKALRVECDINATLTQLVTVILDLNACTEWVYKSKSNILLKR
ncbi:MAG: hypothetical protein JST39_20230, partial [Bacteroidetes bacterium]|nr:hypothetical protein [Bacteroidota bacterium]